jgi:hypothetical protein
VLLFPALVCAAIALLVWSAYLRPVPRQTSAGVIVQKVFQPAGTYTQQPSGIRGGFWTATRIPIPESYLFLIRLEGHPDDLRYALNTVAARDFAVGQRVTVTYEERGLFRKRPVVLGMENA